MEATAGVTPIVSVRLFGNFELRRDDIVLTSTDMGGCKPRHILEILLLNIGVEMSNDRLIDFLWGDQTPDGALQTLERYVFQLRRLVQPGRTTTGPLRTTNGGYVLDPALIDSDLDLFHHLVREAGSATPAVAYSLLRRALDLSAAPLLGDETVSQWAIEARRQIAAQRGELQTRVAEIASALNLPSEAIGWAQAAPGADELDGRAWTTLVGANERVGLCAEALTADDRCRRTFHRESALSLGSAPRALHVRLFRHTAAADGDLPEASEMLICRSGRLRGTVSPVRTAAAGLKVDGSPMGPRLLPPPQPASSLITTLKITQVLMLLAALVIGATAPVPNGQTLLSFTMLGCVLLIGRYGHLRVAAEVAL
ncbi:BTAD domain-containing putative transcriptional regulator [Arthrobacter sp. SX1312]|uniref:AfsR/SARP family transcriptional regulator n=1 Tax=Arthrobacter sp. SX1312 TaxID=2058896 RepID=UPI000CE37151|nr:BTAD domain-containing putative transcriptional regulator [Arthrobacter sp. SX1312]